MQNNRFEFEQLLLNARTRGGWAGDRPMLLDGQLEEIQAIVGERVPQQFARDFVWYLNRIYAQAVEDSLRLRDLRAELANVLGVRGPLPKLPTLIQRQVAELRQSVAQGQPKAIRYTESLRRVLIAHAFLTEGLGGPADAARPVEERVRAGWYTASRLLDIFDDLNIAVKRGREWFIIRQIVRGLAALMHPLTGKIPTRSHRPRDLHPKNFGEQGWFYRLCNLFAGYVYAALPVDARPKQRPTCQRIAREELEKIEAEWRDQGSPRPQFFSQFPPPN